MKYVQLGRITSPDAEQICEADSLEEAIGKMAADEVVERIRGLDGFDYAEINHGFDTSLICEESRAMDAVKHFWGE